MKINCLGFSVTGYGDPSYPASLQNRFDAENMFHQVSYTSLGGLSIDALPFLMATMFDDHHFDVVVLELATSWFSLQKKRSEDARDYLLSIIGYLEKKNIDVVFLHLYRRDIDDNDLVVQAIQELYSGKYPILSLKQIYRQQYLSFKTDGTTDGVHPTQETIKQISGYLFDFFKGYEKRDAINSATKLAAEKFKLIKPDISVENYCQFSSRHGLTLETRKILTQQDVCIKFNDQLTITGVFFIYGPDTGSMTVKINDENIVIAMFDEMSFYRRLGYKALGSHACNELLLTNLAKMNDVVLKRDPWEKVEGVHSYVVGFSYVEENEQ